MSAVRSKVKGWFVLPKATTDGAPLFWLATLVVSALIMIGLVMVLSASSVMSINKHKSAWDVFNHQVMYAALGATAFYFCARVDYHKWLRYSSYLLGLTVVGLILVVIPGIGRSVGGARRWIGVNSTLSFQPSEFAKFAVLLFAARMLAHRVDRIASWRQVLFPLILVVAFIFGLVMLEPDLGTSLEIAIIATGIMWAAGIPKRQLAVLTGFQAVATGLLAVMSPYRMGRLLTFLHPDRDSFNRSYQIKQSLIALGNGGWTGVGLGNGHAKWLFLPAAHTDFIFAIIGEETGVIGAAIVLGLFGVFAVV